MKSIVLAAGAVLTLGFGSAFATPGQSTQGPAPVSHAIKRIWYYSQDPEQYAHPPQYTGPPPVTHPGKGVWYYSEDPEQYAHPPQYAGPPPVTHPGKGVWYYSEDPEQYAHPAY